MRASSSPTTPASRRGAPRPRSAASCAASASRTYIEACGIAPSAVVGALGARAGLYEAATVRVHPTGSVTVFTGTPQPRPGPRDHLRAAGRRPARHPDGERRDRPRRHRQDPVRHGHLRLALAGGRRLGDRQGARQDHRQGQEDRRPPARGGGRGHRVQRRALPSSAPTAPRPSARSPSPPTCRTTTRSRRSSPGSRRRRSTIRRTSPSRPAATSARSRSTPRPASSRSRASPPPTTSAASSTR